MKRLRHHILSALAVSATLAIAVSFGTASAASNTGNHEAPAAGDNGAKPTYTVGIDIPFHPIWDYVAANTDKYFAGQPFNVQFKVLDATTQVPAFAAGELDVFTTPPSFIPRVKQQYGISTAEFFPLAFWAIGPQLLVPKDSPYTSLEQLKGQAVAIPPLATRFGAEEAAVMLQTGQNIRTYFKLDQTPAAAQQLALGRVKAAFIEAPSTYPLLHSGKFKAIWSVHYAFQKYLPDHDPAVVNGGFIARRSFIDAHPKFIAALVAATQDAWNKLLTDPKHVLAVASKYSGISTAQLGMIRDVLGLDVPASRRCINKHDIVTWAAIFKALKKSGFNKEAPADTSQVFVLTCKG